MLATTNLGRGGGGHLPSKDGWLKLCVRKKILVVHVFQFLCLETSNFVTPA